MTQIRNDLVSAGILKNEGKVMEWEPPIPEEDLEARRIANELIANDEPQILNRVIL